MSKKFYGLIALGITMIIALESHSRLSISGQTIEAKFYTWMQFRFIPIAMFVMLVLSIFWLAWGLLEDISTLRKKFRHFIENYEDKEL